MEDKNDIELVRGRVLSIRGLQVIIDRDVADIYGITTRDVNKAVKNNPNKFPNGYIISLSKDEKRQLVENFHRFEPLKHSTVSPHAFTEKGLYMLATIIKGEVATEATIAIIETYAKLRQLERLIVTSNEATVPDSKKIQQLITEVFTDNLPVKIKKTIFTINTGLIKFTVETTRER